MAELLGEELGLPKESAAPQESPEPPKKKRPEDPTLPPQTRLHRRLSQEGNYNEYKELREAYKDKLKAAGMSQQAIKRLGWRLAGLHFPQKPGRPHEVEMTPQIAALLNKSMRSDTLVWPDLLARVDAKRRCTRLESADWIYEHAGTPPEFINPDEVPSRGTLRHLQHIVEDATGRNYDSFLKDFMSKMIPNKQQIDRDSQFTDDDREQFSLLEEFEESLDVATLPINASQSA